MKKKATLRTPRSSQEMTLEYNRAIEPLQKESDRGCALVAASFIDEALSELLLARFEKTPRACKSAQSLLNHTGPLGGFWSKVHLCTTLGLIDEQTFQELECIRNIRNAFAHEYGPSSFTNPKVKNIINRLADLDDKIPGGGKVLISMLSPRDLFIRQAVGVMGKITISHHNTK